MGRYRGPSEELRERRELQCADIPPWPRMEKTRCLGSKEHDFVVDSVNTVAPDLHAQYAVFHTEQPVLGLLKTLPFKRPLYHKPLKLVLALAVLKYLPCLPPPPPVSKISDRRNLGEIGK